MKYATAGDTVKNHTFPWIGEIPRDVRREQLVLIVFAVPQVQILRLDTQSLRHINTHGRADSLVIVILTENDAAPDRLRFNLGPRQLLTLGDERSNASAYNDTYRQHVFPRGHKSLVQRF